MLLSLPASPPPLPRVSPPPKPPSATAAGRSASRQGLRVPSGVCCICHSGAWPPATLERMNRLRSARCTSLYMRCKCMTHGTSSQL